MGKSKEFKTRTLSFVVLPDGDPIFSERATTITICDESGGEFVEVEQGGAPGFGKIAINPKEWPELKSAIDRMVSECSEVA